MNQCISTLPVQILFFFATDPFTCYGGPRGRFHGDGALKLKIR